MLTLNYMNIFVSKFDHVNGFNYISEKDRKKTGGRALPGIKFKKNMKLNSVWRKQDSNQP